MANVDELVEAVTEVIRDALYSDEIVAEDYAKAAIKAVLWGVRGMKIPDTQSPDNLEHRTLDPFALDALLKQLED